MVKFKVGPSAKFFITEAEPMSFDGEKKHCIKYKTVRGKKSGSVKRCAEFKHSPGQPTCTGINKKNMRVGRRRGMGGGCRK